MQVHLADGHMRDMVSQKQPGKSEVSNVHIASSLENASITNNEPGTSLIDVSYERR